MIAVYIDVQNTHKATQKLGWLIDWQKLYIYLSDKYKADHIYYAVGYIASNQGIYTKLEKIGYTMVYKKTMTLPNGEVKGNVDIDIAIKALLDAWKSDLSKAYLITNDGDYNTLVDFFVHHNIFGGLILPDYATASKLLTTYHNINPINLQRLKEKIQKQKDPIEIGSS